MQKKLVDKVIDECTETIEEVKLAKITPENKNEIVINLVLGKCISYS